MIDLIVTRENKYNLRNFQALESLHKGTVVFGHRNYILQRISNMDLDSGKIKNINNI